MNHLKIIQNPPNQPNTPQKTTAKKGISELGHPGGMQQSPTTPQNLLHFPSVSASPSTDSGSFDKGLPLRGRGRNAGDGHGTSE